MPQVSRNMIDIIYMINFLIFSEDRKVCLNNLKEKTKRLVFTNLCFNIINNIYITRFDSNITNNIYSLLSEFREIYKNDANDVELINEAIATLNKLNNKKSIYVSEFNIRFKYIYNFKMRREIIRNDMQYLKNSVDLSVISDAIFFEDMCTLSTIDFCDEHKGNFISLSNIMALVHNFPDVFKDDELTNKMLNLLETNIKYNLDYPKISNQLYSTSILIKGKVLKKMR